MREVKNKNCGGGRNIQGTGERHNTNSLRSHISRDCESRRSASLHSVFYSLCLYFLTQIVHPRVYRILGIFGINSVISNALPVQENRWRRHHIRIHHCSFVCCLFLSIWLPDSSHTYYTAFAPSEWYQCFTPFSGACRTCEVTLLFLDIVEYHFSWLKENLSLSCHFACRFLLMPTSPLLSDLSGKFLGSKNENANHKELYWVLPNKTFLPSLHEKKDNSNPIKARWGKRETELLLPIALLFLCFGLHCSSPAMSPPGRPAYELPPKQQRPMLYISYNIHAVLLSSDTQQRKHDVLNFSLKTSHDSFTT